MTTLVDERFLDGLKPQVDYFNVTIVVHPSADVNYAAFPRVHLAERLSLGINETMVYELYPEDPDGDDRSVQTDLKVLTTFAKNACPECFVWNARQQTLSVHATEVLAGMSIKFQLTYIDDRSELSKFFFFTDIDPMPELEPDPSDDDQSGELQSGEGEQESNTAGGEDGEEQLTGNENEQVLPTPE